MLSINATYCQDAKSSYISKTLPIGNFTQISSSLLTPRESGLTPKAIHLLSYLLSRCSNWIVRTRQLMSELNKGRHYIRTALLELQQKGYVYRRRLKDKLGRIIRMETFVSQEPNFPKVPVNREPCPGFDFRAFDNQAFENRTLYKQGYEKEGYEKQQQPLPIESALESNLNYKESRLPTEHAILVPDLPKEEVISMASEARADIGYPVYGRPIAPGTHLKSVETPEAREQRLTSLKAVKEENKGIAASLSQALKGCVPFMDILAYLKKFGVERVKAAVALSVERDISGKKNPGAYLSSAIRNNWAASMVSPIVEKHEEAILVAQQEKYTLEENKKWWKGLTVEEKQKSFADASWKHYALSSHFSTMGISILDAEFPEDSGKRWAFSMLMETLGRQADRSISA